jgi:MoxR-like ATPase
MGQGFSMGSAALVRIVPLVAADTGSITGTLAKPGDEIAPAFTEECVAWGAGTRAVQYLVLGAKARAAIAGEYNRDARPRARRGPPLVLRHRVMTNFHAEAEGMTPDKVVRRLLEEVKPPRRED